MFGIKNIVTFLKKCNEYKVNGLGNGRMAMLAFDGKLVTFENLCFKVKESTFNFFSYFRLEKFYAKNPWAANRSNFEIKFF